MNTRAPRCGGNTESKQNAGERRRLRAIEAHCTGLALMWLRCEVFRVGQAEMARIAGAANRESWRLWENGQGEPSGLGWQERLAGEAARRLLPWNDLWLHGYTELPPAPRRVA